MNELCDRDMMAPLDNKGVIVHANESNAIGPRLNIDLSIDQRFRHEIDHNTLNGSKRIT